MSLYTGVNTRMREGHGLRVWASNLLPLQREVGKDTQHAAEYHVVVACGVKTFFLPTLLAASHTSARLLFVGFNPFLLFGQTSIKYYPRNIVIIIIVILIVRDWHESKKNAFISLNRKLREVRQEVCQPYMWAEMIESKITASRGCFERLLGAREHHCN